MTSRIINAHVLDGLAQLQDESVHCVVTSPPYYGMRDYGIEPQFWPDCWSGSLGLEPTPTLYIEHLVAVFAEVRRVLRRDGTLWIVIGDSYNNFRSQKGPGQAVHGRDKLNGKPSPLSGGRGWSGLKEKDLCGIPWRLAFALQDGGWWLRQDNVWHKPNPMPESIEDRTTRSHEYVFHLSKSERYYYDGRAIKEAAAYSRPNAPDRDDSAYDVLSRNKRSVWTVATVPPTAPHFATYPPALIEPCILAGCPVGGTVLDPFIGVGTTAIVAERLARNCIGIDLSPKYAAIAERRARSPGFPLEPLAMAARVRESGEKPISGSETC